MSSGSPRWLQHTPHDFLRQRRDLALQTILRCDAVVLDILFRSLHLALGLGAGFIHRVGPRLQGSLSPRFLCTKD
jgi:hypothetical protein